MSFERTGVRWPRERFDVALESMDCECDLIVERVLASSEREAGELARRRQEEPERWYVVDVRSAEPPIARGAA